MTTVRRLRAVSAVLGLAAIATCSHVWGEPAGDKSKNTLTGRVEPPPVKRQLAEELGATKFTDRNLVLYETVGGDRLFALQVQPKLEAAKEARPRDLLILVDTSASQVRGPLDTARQIADGLVAAAKADDRVAIMTVNTPAATQNLTRALEPAQSAKVKEALKALKQEVPFGGNDLKNAFEKAIAAFDGREGRQRVIVYLGSGKSLLSPIANADRMQLCEKMVGKEISFFPVPLGANLEPVNLHGFTTGTGGLLVRMANDDTAATAVEKLTKAIAAPVLYTKKFTVPVEVTECYPTKLPPLRSDSPTLVVGKLRPGANFVYTVDGELNGKHTSLRLTEPVPVAEIDNFFLIGMVEQWKAADRKEAPSPFRADRALAMSFERGRLQRDELNAQGAWAVEEGKLDVAAQMFGQARKIDPQDPDADAGMKIVEKMKAGLLNKDKLRDALGKPDDPAILIQKQGGKVKLDRGRMDKMVAMLQPEEKMAGPNAVAQQPGGDANFPPDKEPLLRLQQQRQAVEEQRITQIVNEAERQARRILPSDPEAAHDVLKRTLASIRDNADLGPQARQNLMNRLEVSLRNADIQGARIKRDLEEALRREADARARIAAADERLRGEEQVQRRIRAFNELMNTGRVEEAHKEALVLQADTVNRGGQIHPTMVAAHDMGINAIHIREQQEIKRATEERYLLTMLQVDKSHIPFPDEPPVGFPPAAIWRELTKRRKLAGYDSVGLGENQADRNKANQIHEKLSKPVNLEKGIDANTALKDALDFLADRYDLTIIIDSKAFEAIGVAKVEEQPVTLPRMVGVSMATVLRLLLAQVKGDVYTGTYLIRRDFIEVTTTYNAAAEKVVRAYPVADLVIPIPNSVNQQAL
ncbi:MAG: VWA domain-containing protein, partial [Planctomycetia bacterium]|nr:VWA domain-containing protein [Planctomycetia bacterium]